MCGEADWAPARVGSLLSGENGGKAHVNRFPGRVDWFAAVRRSAAGVVRQKIRDFRPRYEPSSSARSPIDGQHRKYTYELPKELIAQQPLRVRSDARLMVVDRRHNSLSHKHVRDLPEILEAGDCLVLNNTRVVPARLVGFRTRTGGRWEGLFLEAAEGGIWRILGKTRGKLTAGEALP